MRQLAKTLLFLLFLEPVFSQQEAIRFKNITTAEGLSQSWVRAIYQDDQGYMWFGTADGLNRYDGYEFKVFLPDPDNIYSIGNMVINQISKKSTNELWVCTNNGVYFLNQITEKFYPFNQLAGKDILTIYEDSEKKLWFGGAQGLYKYNPADNSIKSYYNNPNIEGSLSSNLVRCVFEDSKKNIWIGTFSGLDHYDRKKDSFTNFRLSANKGKNLKDSIWCISEDKYGRLWLGISQDGLYIFDYSKERPENSQFHHVLSGSPNTMQIDADNNLWIGNGSGKGLIIFNLTDFKLNRKPEASYYFQSLNDEHSIASNSISSIYKDRSGDIWIGTYGGGINYYSNRAKKFYNVKFSSEKNSISSNLVNSIFEEEKYLWIGTESGLDRLDKETGNTRHFKHNASDPGSIVANAIYAILKDTKGNLWIGSWNGGLSLYNYNTGTFKNYLPGPGPGSLSNPNVFSICEDSQGNIWAGTIGGGINQFNRKTGKFKTFLHNDSIPGSLYGNAANDILITSQGKMWVSLYEALDLYDEISNTFIHFVHDPKDTNTISAGFILSVFEDSKQNIWIATTMGLNLYNPQNNTFRHFTTKNGLPSNTIQSVLEDNKGNLWLSTNNGLAVFNNAINLPPSPGFRIYDKIDGLPGNEFTVRAAYKNSQGMLYFGTSLGYTFFDPKTFRDNLIPPTIVITEFNLLQTLGNESEKNNLYNKEINFVDEIKLSYKQSNFIIRYAALNFLNSDKNQYKFRLEGYEEGWHYVGEQRIATYTNIHPGNYTFIVSGTNNDGKWATTPKTIHIVITPPWWGTIIFKIAAVILTMLLIVSVFRIRLRILQNQKRLLKEMVASRTNQLSEVNTILEERQEEIAIQNEELSKHRNHLEQLIEERTAQLESAKAKAEESDKLKSAFLANMSHEIRTPMNAILGFASLLDEKNINHEDKCKFIQMINTNSETLLVLIDDIIDISLIESNQLVLIPREFDAFDVLVELEDYFNLKNNKNIRIEFQRNNEQELIIHTDPVRFRQILNNLLNNSCKYTDSGSVQFGYEKLSNEVHFFVKDSGIGIQPEHFESIFNHFFKIENETKKLYRGTGIGLAICKSLIEKMGGRIWVESKVNIGSTFHFTLPLKITTTTTVKKRYDTQNYELKFKNTRVVIAEDEPANFELLKTYLKNSGAEIHWAQNGREAVNIIHSISDTENMIVLMDIKMPEMDGYQAMREIRKTHNKIPIIAVTAYAQSKDKEKIMNEGFDDYISKPIKKEILISTIYRHISIR